MSRPVDDEIRSLADAMFDGTIDAVKVRRLETLLEKDQSCLQTYLEMVNLHGALLTQADSRTDQQAALTTLQEFSEACERRERRSRFRLVTFSAVSAVVLCGALGWLFLTTAFRPAPLGNIAHLTANASSQTSRLEPGQVLRKGSSLSIEEGILTIELANTMVDILGPAELKLSDDKLIQLQRGTLTARVLPGGEGFTVRTPDAEVVDLGTEFSVQYSPQQGTDVAVRSGRAKASLLDNAGLPSKVLDLTTNRAARLQRSQGTLSETTFQSQVFEQVDRTRGGIRSISGHLRTPVEMPVSLKSEATTTPNHMLVIPERQNVVLQSDLEVEMLTGRQRLPAGTTVSSYLVHYDPTNTSKFAPRGAVTFFSKITAVLTDTESLVLTDSIFSLPEIVFDQQKQRGLERDLDQIQLSDDLKTVSFFFGMSPPIYLDQVRILVSHHSL